MKQKVEVSLSFALYVMAVVGVLYCLGFRPTNIEIALGVMVAICLAFVVWIGAFFVLAAWYDRNK